MTKITWLNFVDLETTGFNPMLDEILTCYIYSENGEQTNELNINLKPCRWDHKADDAAKIHGINELEAMSYGDRKESFREICAYLLDHPGKFVCHANAKLSGFHFDWAFLESYAFFYDSWFWWNQTVSKKQTVISTHSMAKELGFKKASLDYLYRELFNEEFKHHDAKEDVKATRRIYYELIQRHGRERELLQGA